MRFVIGDRVAACTDIDKRGDGTPVIPSGLTGTVIADGDGYFDNGVGVRWDVPEPYRYFHSCGGLCEYGYGYFVLEMDLIKLQEDEDISEVDELEFLRCVMCGRQ